MNNLGLLLKINLLHLFNLNALLHEKNTKNMSHPYDSILSELCFIHALGLSLSDTVDNLDSMAGKTDCVCNRCMCLY